MLAPYFLNAAGQANKKRTDRIILKTINPDPSIYSITSNGSVVVKTIKNGEKQEQEYSSLSGTTLSISCDANTSIIIDGQVTDILLGDGELDFVSCKVMSDYLHTLSLAKSYNMQDVDVKRANVLTSIDTSYCAKIIKLDISNKPLLTSINLQFTYGLVELDMSGCTGITDTFSIPATPRLEKWNLSGCTGITTLNLSTKTALQHIDLSGCTGITSLNVQNCYELRELDVSDCTSLTTLDCSYCYYLEYLDFSNNTQLESLRCGYTDEKVLDLSKNTALKTLWAERCTYLSKIDISTATLLTSLTIGLCELITEIYAIAQNSSVATAIAGAITKCALEHGTVYVNSADTYYSTIETAANNAGWTIAPLPA